MSADRRKDLERYLSNWRGEVDSVYLYAALSRHEKNPELSKVYAKLSAAEEKHARFWEVKIRSAGGQVPVRRQSLRSRVLSFLAGRFGAPFVIPTITEMERSDRTSYDSQPEAKGSTLPADERSHARLLQAIVGSSKKGMEGVTLARLEGRHRGMRGNALRAAVLGANDGLVSNLSLIMGVAGALSDVRTVLITGMAGLLAGACSMAMGEWLSVQSSRELYLKQISIEAQELIEAPQEEEAELALIYQAKGLPADEAEKLAHTLIADEANALKTLSREELGIDPDELGGSAREAAITSFVLFAIGAIVPLAPFFFTDASRAVPASLIVSAVGLFVIGGMITLFTGRSVLFSGTRQLVIGLAAAGVTYGIGRWIGVSIAG